MHKKLNEAPRSEKRQVQVGGCIIHSIGLVRKNVDKCFYPKHPT